MIRMLMGGYGSNLGGVERFMLNLLAALPKSEYQTDCVVMTDKLPSRAEIASLADRIIYCPPRRSKPLTYASSIRKIIHEGRYDIVWSNQCSLSDSTLIVEAKKQRVPMRILYSHASDNLGGKVTAALHFINRGQVKKATHHWACTKEAWDYFFLGIVPKENLSVFPNAVFPEHYAYNDAVAASLKAKYSVEDRVVLGSIGRLSDEKNHEFIIRLMPELIKRFEKIVYFIIGQGYRENELKHLVRSLDLDRYVFMPGFIDNVADHYNMLDVLLMPSRHEGLPFVLIEGQMNGLPILASRNISQDGTLTDSISYLPLDRDVWLKRISHLIENPAPTRRNRLLDLSDSPFNMKFAGELFDRIIREYLRKQ